MMVGGLTPMLQTLQMLTDEVAGVLVAGGMEGTGVPWPGGVVVAGAGMTAEGGHVSMVLLATLFSLGYCVGALAQYTVGRVLGEAALGWLPAVQQAKLQRFMDRYGPLAVLWGRPFAIGNYVSIPAGMMRMPLPRFLAYTFLGTWPWALGMVFIGRFAGEQLGELTTLVQPYVLPTTLAVAAVTLAFGGWKWLRHRAGALQA
jgi:membrane protein DedA with SNARE-associated domain